MLTAAQVFVLLAASWAVVALAFQVVGNWAGGRHDFSVRTGSPTRGVIYSFTAAMSPAHKESIRRHPIEFGIGMLMHLGTVVALAGLLAAAIAPTRAMPWFVTARPLLIASLLAALFLLVRRLRTPNLAIMSAADDYLAALATGGLLALATAAPIKPPATTVLFLLYGGLLLVYLPLGKLRHLVFFFVARGNYGRRLGYRGVYPPATRHPAERTV